MARGNSILINQLDTYHGFFVEGTIAAGYTPKPGSIAMADPSIALIGGRMSWKAYASGTDGLKTKGPYIVILEDKYQGKTCTDAYAAADHAFGYIPRSGDELNLLILNLSGTADDHAKGEALMVDDPTGLLIAHTGSPQVDFAQLNETITDPVADTLAWCTVN